MQHPRNLSQLHLLLLPHPPLCLPRGLILSPPTEGQVTPLLLWVKAACGIPNSIQVYQRQKFVNG